MLEKYSRTRHAVSESPAVCAYMYTPKLSPGCSGDVGSEMNAPPPLTALGADSPEPTVDDCSDASHQLGAACSDSVPAETVLTKSPPTYSVTWTADVRPLALNHACGSEVLLQWPMLWVDCLAHTADDGERLLDEGAPSCMVTLDGTFTAGLPYSSVSWYATRTLMRSTHAPRLRSTAVTPTASRCVTVCARERYCLP